MQNNFRSNETNPTNALKVYSKNFSNYQKRHLYLLNPTNLITARIELNLSQVEIAKSVDLSRINYGKIEKAISSTTKDTALKISNYFNKELNDLFYEINGHYFTKTTSLEQINENLDSSLNE